MFLLRPSVATLCLLHAASLVLAKEAPEVAQDLVVPQPPPAPQKHYKRKFPHSCPNLEDTVRLYQTFHSPNVCTAQDRFLDAQMKQERDNDFGQLQATKMHRRIKDQQTVVCPALPVNRLSSHKNPLGLKSAWVVENGASTAIVLCWIDPYLNKPEASAMDPTIVPPQADPKAILQPGQHAVVYGYESQVFYARELLPNGSSGDVLLQHRIGLVPVGQGTDNLQCQTQTTKKRKLLVDKDKETPKAVQDPLLTLLWKGASTVIPSYWKQVGEYATALAAVPLQLWVRMTESETYEEVVVVDPNHEEDDHPHYQRAPPRDTMECRQLQVGFRNKSPCPLHAHWVSTFGPVVAGAMGNPYDCQEEFRFHLGINAQAENFMADWASTIKFESTFLGHQYVFRLASDPNQIIDVVDFRPTRVVDCPTRRQGGIPQVVDGKGVAVDLGLGINATSKTKEEEGQDRKRKILPGSSEESTENAATTGGSGAESENDNQECQLQTSSGNGAATAGTANCPASE